MKPTVRFHPFPNLENFKRFIFVSQYTYMYECQNIVKDAGGRLFSGESNDARGNGRLHTISSLVEEN
jgi:hypothetical protein